MTAPGLPAQIFSRGSYVRRLAAGITAAAHQAAAGQQDAERDDMMRATNAIIRFVGLFTNPDGTLREEAAVGTLALRWATQITATAAQTAFTVPSYDASDTIAAFANGVLLAPSVITHPGGTTVTLPAQLVGTIVVIYAYAAAPVAAVAADDVDVADTGGFFTGVTVEVVLAEIGAILTDPSYLETLLALATYLKADGSVPLTGDLDADGNTVKNLAAPVDADDAVRLQDIDPAALFAAISGMIAGAYLPLAGGTVTGTLVANVLQLGGNMDANSKKITNLAAGVDPGDAVRVDQLPDVPAAAGFTRVTFAAAGAISPWVVPAGVTKVRVRAWGGGGGGDSINSGINAKAGGGGGAYAEVILTVVPAQTISGTVGAGGAANNDGTDTTVAYSGDGTFSLTAGKGRSSVNTGTGGIPVVAVGVAGAGALSLNGQDGAAGASLDGTSGLIVVGGVGGSSPMGGMGGRGGSVSDTGGSMGSLPGYAPGGGGGTGYTTGAAGAAGQIVIEY